MISFKDYQPGRNNGLVPLVACVIGVGTCAATWRNPFLETYRLWHNRENCSSAHLRSGVSMFAAYQTPEAVTVSRETVSSFASAPFIHVSMFPTHL